MARGERRGKEGREVSWWEGCEIWEGRALEDLPRLSGVKSTAGEELASRSVLRAGWKLLPAVLVAAPDATETTSATEGVVGGAKMRSSGAELGRTLEVLWRGRKLF